MIELSDLKIEKGEEWTRLSCKIDGLDNLNKPLNKTNGKQWKGIADFKEQRMWFALKNEDANFFSDKVYDPFLLVPLYIGMFFGRDLYVHGKVSKVLYNNINNYVKRIFCDFSNYTRNVNLEVEGFCTVEFDPDVSIIGTGISCGVDSFQTIYERFELESDPMYRINRLFFFNCGSHGNFYNEKTKKIWMQRYSINKTAADEMGLPVSLMDTNLHAFSYFVGSQPIIYLSIYSCILSMQKTIRRYYTSSEYEFGQVLLMGRYKTDWDISCYAGPFLVPLIKTENVEIIPEGSQYYRSEKTELISKWHIAQKHLDVCVRPNLDGSNCSCCFEKCMPTMFALETAGRLDNFSEVFNIETYRKNLFKYECQLVIDRKKDGFSQDHYIFAKSHNRKLPPYAVAFVRMLPALTRRVCVLLLRKLLPQEKYVNLARKVRKMRL